MNNRDPNGADLLGVMLANRYQVIERIGHGGMALVFAGHDRVLGRDVALKILRPEKGGSPAWRQRLLQEAMAVSRLVHPHIVAVHDVGETDDIVFIVMERLIGCTVGDLIQDAGALDVPLALEIGCQAASALDLAHLLGVVHRDVKSDNLYLVDTATGTLVKLFDFSVAKTPGTRAGRRLTTQDTIFGTPEYMAPEQGRGEVLGPQADIYGLGVSLYEMIVGHLPYDGESLVEIIDLHRNAPIPRICEAVPLAPIGLSELVEQMMAKDPADRPSSAGDVREVLASILESIAEQRVRTWTPPAPSGATSAYATVRGPRPKIEGEPVRRSSGSTDRLQARAPAPNLDIDGDTARLGSMSMDEALALERARKQRGG